MDKRIIIESIIKTILTESQESKSQSEAIKLVMNKFGWDKERANQFVRVELRNDLTALRDKQLAKFTLGVTRMFCIGQLANATIISQLNSTLNLLKPHINDYDRNLNNLSAQELIERFRAIRQQNIDNTKTQLGSMEFGESHYTIVPINTFEEAQKYYKYTYQQSPWCLTHMEEMFNSYTCDGINQIYFCLRDGFESVQPIVGEGAPLDDYGLSMISVIVDSDGALTYCTTRWNHSNGGNDNAMDTIQLSKVLNVNFFNVFKPNNKWKEELERVLRLLKSGYDVESVFDNVPTRNSDFAIVKLKGKWNLLSNDNKFLFNNWITARSLGGFHNGFATVMLDYSVYNYVNMKGEFLSDTNFKNVYPFSDGFGLVEIDYDNYNFIKPDGSLLNDKGFKQASMFENGYAKVEVAYREFNIIDKNGKYLLDKNYRGVNLPTNGIICVHLDDGFNYKKLNGDWLLPQNVTSADPFVFGVGRIFNNDWNSTLIDTDGILITPYWFRNINILSQHMAIVEMQNGRQNMLSFEKGLILPEPADNVQYFTDDTIMVKNGNKYNLYDMTGKALTNQWWDNIYQSCYKNYICKLVKGDQAYIMDFNKQLKQVDFYYESKRKKHVIREFMQDGFSFNELNKVDDYDKFDYCCQYLGDPIGSGSSRAVFEIDDAQVLKVAFEMIDAACEQNKAEYMISRKANSPLLPRVLYAADDFSWIVTERVIPCEDIDVFKILGIPVNEIESENQAIDKYDKSHPNNIGLNNYKTPKDNDNTNIDFELVIEALKLLINRDITIRELPPLLRNYIQSNTWFKELANLVYQFNLHLDDITVSNLGIAMRNGKPALVLLDSGLTYDIFLKYYL